MAATRVSIPSPLWLGGRCAGSRRAAGIPDSAPHRPRDRTSRRRVLDRSAGTEGRHRSGGLRGRERVDLQGPAISAQERRIERLSGRVAAAPTSEWSFCGRYPARVIPDPAHERPIEPLRTIRRKVGRVRVRSTGRPATATFAQTAPARKVEHTIAVARGIAEVERARVVAVHDPSGCATSFETRCRHSAGSARPSPDRKTLGRDGSAAGRAASARRRAKRALAGSRAADDENALHRAAPCLLTELGEPRGLQLREILARMVRRARQRRRGNQEETLGVGRRLERLELIGRAQSGSPDGASSSAAGIGRWSGNRHPPSAGRP